MSGRSIPDLRKRLPIEELSGVSGDHGASRIYKGKVHADPNAESAREQILPLATLLKEITDEWPGAYLEIKQFSLSLHYRQLAIERHEEFFGVIEKTFRQVHPENLEMKAGKCVFEFRHSGINKESALQWFLQRLSDEPEDRRTLSGSGPYPVMIGDDTTDWNSIKMAIHLGGHGIWVGDNLPDSSLPHPARLSSPDHVWEWLKQSWRLVDSNP